MPLLLFRVESQNLMCLAPAVAKVWSPGFAEKQISKILFVSPAALVLVPDARLNK